MADFASYLLYADFDAWYSEDLQIGQKIEAMQAVSPPDINRAQPELSLPTIAAHLVVAKSLAEHAANQVGAVRRHIYLLHGLGVLLAVLVFFFRGAAGSLITGPIGWIFGLRRPLTQVAKDLHNKV